MSRKCLGDIFVDMFLTFCRSPAGPQLDPRTFLLTFVGHFASDHPPPLGWLRVTAPGIHFWPGFHFCTLGAGGGCRAPAFHFCIADAAHLVSTFVGVCWNDAAHLFSTFVGSTGHCNWRDAANLSFSKQNHIIFEAKSYHFRNKIISFSNHVGVALGSLWDHFGVTLGSL